MFYRSVLISIILKFTTERGIEREKLETVIYKLIIWLANVFHRNVSDKFWASTIATNMLYI